MRKKLKVIICIIVLGFIAYCCKKNTSTNIGKSEETKHKYYIELVDKKVSELPLERKQKREKWLKELKINPVYIALVNNKNTSQDYLPVLNAISDAIKNSYSIDDISEFGIAENIAIDIEKSEQGKDKMNFIIISSSLSLAMNGGLPKELVEVFERFKSKYNLYGEAQTNIYNNNGEKVIIEKPFNLSYAFGLFDPKDEDVLNAIFESTQKGISQWNKDDGQIYENRFMALKSAYMQHLKQVYPDSQYLIDVDFEVAASDLTQEYKANVVSADEKYKNKKIAITGRIGNIGKDVMNNPYISFRGEFLEGVTCYFSDENNKIISKLNKGEQITIIGECKGLTLTNVIIKDCKIY
nr:hypothetical protein [uncultured Flavobacterium sp.]